MAAPLVFGIAVGTIVIALKEVADFIQIGMVSYQTGKKFSGSRAVRGGSVAIDGNVVTVMIDSVRVALPIEDAAAAAGVAGAGGRGEKPRVAGASPAAGAAAALERARALEAGLEPPEYVMPGRPQAGQDRTVGAGRPDSDSRPFTLREFITLQEQGKERRSQRIAAAEAEELQLRLAQEAQLAILDAQIARERIAAQVDIARMQIVARLEEQRRELLSRHELQRRELASRLQLQRERLAAEDRQLERRFALQGGLQQAEQRWKTSEASADRAWRERVEKEQSEVAQYRLNLNKDLALTRSLDAAEGIATILRRFGGQPQAVVSFASVFGR